MVSVIPIKIIKHRFVKLRCRHPQVLLVHSGDSSLFSCLCSILLIGIVRKFIIIGLLLPLAGFCEDLGELDFQNYYGPSNPEFEYDFYGRKIKFRDHAEYDAYIYKRIQPEIFNLNDYLENEFKLGLYCPENELEKNKDYYQYLVRILTVSYLVEAMREYEYTSLLLRDAESCRVDYKKVLSECRPKTKDMKDFIKNSDFVFNEIEPIFVPLEKSKDSAINSWLKQVNQSKAPGLTAKRIHASCLGGKCGKLDKKSIVKKLVSTCNEDQSLLNQICSENDLLFGASYLSEVFPLIARSNALRALPDEDYAQGCLRRFIESNTRYQKVYHQLVPIYSYFYSRFLDVNSRLERGRLFSIGALKEFQNKGLKNIFKEELKLVKMASQKIDKEIKRPKIETFSLPEYKVKKKLIPPKKIAKAQIKKKEEKRSAFQIASRFRKKFDLASVKVDMNKWKFDYTFTAGDKEVLFPAVTKFSSQTALKDMKKLDHLGSEKSPLPLRFLKFLIDEDMHQGLFNLTLILGEEFYILNDLDRNDKSKDLVTIQNDPTTNYRWQVRIIAPSTNRPEKK